jgi:hypothetical protein
MTAWRCNSITGQQCDSMTAWNFVVSAWQCYNRTSWRIPLGAFCVRCSIRDRACKAQIRAIADEKTDISVLSHCFCASRMGQRIEKAHLETTLNCFWYCFSLTSHVALYNRHVYLAFEGWHMPHFSIVIDISLLKDGICHTFKST